jgi:hypothetical protein
MDKVTDFRSISGRKSLRSPLCDTAPDWISYGPGTRIPSLSHPVWSHQFGETGSQFLGVRGQIRQLLE